MQTNIDVRTASRSTGFAPRASTPGLADLMPKGGRPGLPSYYEVHKDLSGIKEELRLCTAHSVNSLERALKRQSHMVSLRLRLGEVMLALGYISEPELALGLETQSVHKHSPLGETLVKLGLLTPTKLKIALARKLGYPLVDISSFPLDTQLLAKLPHVTALRLQMMPLCMIQGEAIVASCDPTQADALKDEVAFILGCKVRLVLCESADMLADITRLYKAYGQRPTEFSQTRASAHNPTLVTPKASASALSETQIDDYLDKVISYGKSAGVTDIHLESDLSNGALTVRMRRDGKLFTYERNGSLSPTALVHRIKILCDMDISVKRMSQEARHDFVVRGASQAHALLVRTLPTHAQAEDVIIRLLNTSEPRNLSEIDLLPQNFKHLQIALAKPAGLVLTAGAAGSGQTTTLHAALKHLANDEVKVWSAEELLEYINPAVRQMQVSQKHGPTYAQAVEAILSADPDVVMVASMRDPHVAHMVVEAALNGQLMLAPMRTSSAAETITRLLDMGIDRFAVADALQVVLGQRLVRKLCPECRVSTPMTEHQVHRLAQEYVCELPEEFQPNIMGIVDRWHHQYAKNDQLMSFRSVGCKCCNQTGYSGRMAIHELIVADQSLRQLINSGADQHSIHEWALRSSSFASFRQDGIVKALLGLTSLDEVNLHCSI